MEKEDSNNSLESIGISDEEKEEVNINISNIPEDEFISINNNNNNKEIENYKEKKKFSFFHYRKSSIKFKKKKENIPIHLSFKNISYEIITKKKFKKIKTSKIILNNVSGYVKAGQVLAIMGGSGAGKTTLLNILAGRISKGIVHGEVRLNGQLINEKIRKNLGHIAGYVMQDDVMLTGLTVRETLIFSALLKLPKNLTKKQKLERVEDIISKLSLRKCADNVIGDVQKKGISGGERKRTSIGIEMINDPSLLFLDEPTSGLDSFTAYNIMETLINLAKNDGRTIICTIHQPRSNIFSLFDMLLLLSEGQVVYFGPASNAISYFSKLNFVCPNFANPADYLLDISSIDSRTEENNEFTKKTSRNANKSLFNIKRI